MSDQTIRILTADGRLRAAVADTTGVVAEICRRQGTDPTASVALGRVVTGTVLLGALLKGEERLAVQVEGNGPLKRLQAEIDAHGGVRGSIRNPVCNLPPRNDRFDVAAAVGRAGFLHVVKDLGLKEPYRGMVQLVSSEIAEDLAWYLTTSEQIPSSVGLGVNLDAGGGIAAAGGFLVQAMPGADDATLAALEERLRQLPPTTTLLREGLGPDAILKEIFGDVLFAAREEVPLAFRCGCSRRQALAILRLLPEAERLALRDEPQVGVTCEFCREVYSFTPDEVDAARH